jgi:hypothetical protein
MTGHGRAHSDFQWPLLVVSADSFALVISRERRLRRPALDSRTITLPRSWLVPQASAMSPLHRRAASNRRNTYLTALIRKSCARVSAGRCSGPTQLAWRDIPRARSASRRALRAAARGFCESSTARSARVAALNAAVIVVMSAVISVIPMAAAAIMLMIVISYHRCRSRYAAARSAHSILLLCDH